MKPGARQTLIEKFRVVAQERLQQLDRSLVALEANPADEAAATTLLREIHTLKGEAKLMGFADINLVAHRIEDLLGDAKKQGFRIAPARADFLLQSFDLIGQLLAKSAGDLRAPDLPAFVAEVERLLAADAAPPPAASPPSAPPHEAGGSEATAPAQQTRPSPTSAGDADRPARAGASASAAASTRVEAAQLEQLTQTVGDLLRFHEQTVHALRTLRATGETLRTELARRALAGRSADAGRQARNAGETIDPSALSSVLLQTLGRGYDGLLQAGAALTQLEQLVSDLRLVPLLNLLARYPRAMRDLAREHGKRVQVGISGGELRVDQTVLDRLEDPLLHLLRNCVDHGIEAPEERQRAGKPGEGSVTISVVARGAQVEVTVADDGRGLDAGAIRASALRRGLIDEEQATQLSEAQALRLIWTPGFSTRTQVSELSGRGIGLDVVKSAIEGLGGSVGLETERGRGTRFVLRVPISVALTPALLVGFGNQTLALPLHGVVGVIDPCADQVLRAGSGEVLRLDAQTFLPIDDLARILGQPAPAPGESTTTRLVILAAEERRVALRVARVIGERDLVQRPVDPLLASSRLLIGAAVLEFGEPVLLLNVAELVRLTGSVAGAAPERGIVTPDAANAGSALRGRRVLLVEDSEIFRDTLVAVVGALGAVTREATDGVEALAAVAQELPELVITDLEMPQMDGFALIARLRAAPATRRLPILVLSGLGSSDDKRRAAAAGADAYLVKADFSPKALAAALTRLLGGAGPAR